MKLIALVIAVLLFGTLTAFAKGKPKINDEQAILAIIGEAENQGHNGMYAVACAIRNRGTLVGVYGLFNERVRNKLYSSWVYSAAQYAWEKAKSQSFPDITNGATGWGNAKDMKSFMATNWWKKCHVCYEYRDHFFYKENHV